MKTKEFSGNNASETELVGGEPSYARIAEFLSLKCLSSQPGPNGRVYDERTDLGRGGFDSHDSKKLMNHFKTGAFSEDEKNGGGDDSPPCDGLAFRAGW